MRVFLIFKESLTNIVNHSGATQVRIEFEFSREYLTLKIADNRAGFEAGNIGAALFADQKGGHGIFSMKKGAAEKSGKFELSSEMGTFQLPLSEPSAVAV